MRNEDRKGAQSVAARIVKWQSGLDELDEPGLEELRRDWSAKLIMQPGEESVDAMWSTVVDAHV
jgi:hypothetical protein